MFGPHVEYQIWEHARAVAPAECCGYISAQRQYVPLQNVASDTQNSFQIAKGRLPMDALAVIHSHPGGPFAPSEDDMQSQIALDIPWGIAAFNDDTFDLFWFGDGAPMLPLIGRGFRHGVTDCYSVCRDFYRTVHNIELPQFARSWEWWNNQDNLYLNGYSEAGFKEINSAALRPGDALLFQIHATTPNHAAIYLGDGLILHHTSGKRSHDPSHLSTVEPIGRYARYLVKVLTHENNHIDRTIGQKIWPVILP